MSKALYKAYPRLPSLTNKTEKIRAKKIELRTPSDKINEARSVSKPNNPGLRSNLFCLTTDT